MSIVLPSYCALFHPKLQADTKFWSHLSCIFLTLALHAARLQIALVEREGLIEEVRRVRVMCLRVGALEVVAQHGAEVGVRAVLDDLLGALARRLAAQIGHALLRDDDVASCSGWSTCEQNGTTAEILPTLATDGV